MSTIDRAMSRLRGEPEPATAATGTLAPAAGDAAPEPASPAVPATPAPAAVTAALPEAAPPAATVSPVEPSTGEQVEARRHDTTARIDLDFDALGARGFLVPGAHLDQMSEEYQHIKRRLLGNMVEGIMPAGTPSNLVMVTSSVPGEGKTFTSMNLAISLAMEMERTVLLIDTDIIKSDLTRLIGAYGRLGLFDLLSRPDLSIPDVLLKSNVPKLSVIPAGTSRAQVSEKLASESMRRLTAELATRYRDRIVVFDCPPVLATSGATALAPYIGQIVMVVEAARTSRETLKHAVLMLEPNPITGLILNKVREQRAGGHYYYYYGYQQGSAPAQ